MEIPTPESPNRLYASLIMISVLVSSISVWAQSKSPTSALENARQRYLGKSVRIMGPHESSSPGLLAQYMNWRSAKRGADGRYRQQSAETWARLPFGYERHGGSIIAVQLSEKQPKGSSFDFVVRFDDGVIAMCTSPLELAAGDFKVVAPNPSTKK
jgi:hypothetical protein